MKFIIEKSFDKDVDGLPKNIQLSILNFIKAIEAAHQISDLTQIKKLKTNKKDQRECYRHKIGNYRLGFILEHNTTVRLVIVGHRKNIYKNFP
ncbi:type II toxin-antitoxin system RelE/ParE family toxin [uncultured Mucilaginibacter sp.]|uniref:type II toxin-antitoxin system RelE family toxin n=1 Tax=uncultured Mucilaginibacter sp. TaxID=797541 RepID=UPI00263653A3|nr:type II toxin-antitoxin system RelE/ParE family toxin [uncultured Mucilaginibacter sp.]